MTTWTVSSAAQLQSALSGAAGGDTIVLQSGNYGELDLTQSYSSYVTIQSASPLGAVFTDVTFDGASNIKLAQITTTGVYTQTDTTNHDLIVTDSKISGGSVIIAGYGSTSDYNIQITNNTIGPAIGNDMMQVIGDSHNILIQDNQMSDVIATDPAAHPDLIQMFQDFSDGDTPHDITIRGNLLYDDPSTGVIGSQGIFISDAGPSGYQNILVEQNLIAPVLTNALTIQSGTDNVVIQDNTVTDRPHLDHEQPGLRQRWNVQLTITLRQRF